MTLTDISLATAWLVKRMPDFVRDSRGTPWIDSLTERTLRGRPRRVRASRPSSFVSQILSHYVLHQRDLILAFLGAARLTKQELDVLYSLDPFDPQTATILADAVADSLASVGANFKAQRGTWVHAVLESVDRREAISDELYAAGVRFGFDRGAVDGLAEHWLELLEQTGLRILTVEATCVNDEFGTAGTLDRIAELTRPLRFGFTELPAGLVVCLDLKSSALYLASDVPSYWNSYVGQIFLYASSTPYLVATEKGRRDVRMRWPWTIDETHGLIGHINLDPTEGTVGRCQLWLADLVAGRQAVELAQAARQFEARRDLFTLAAT